MPYTHELVSPTGEFYVSGNKAETARLLAAGYTESKAKSERKPKAPRERQVVVTDVPEVKEEKPEVETPVEDK
jgi:hypothetical protein